MIRLLDRRPFISGLVVGFIGTGIIGKKLKKIFDAKVTIIQLDMSGLNTCEKQDKKEQRN